MKKLLVVANWKSNKTVREAIDWVTRVKANHVDLVVCAPFTALHALSQVQPSVHLGAQNVSQFDEGAYTGEISARMIKEVADWVIIGHSERRQIFGETDAILSAKVQKARNIGLRIIYCVQDENTIIPDPVDVVAYEPTWAIGTGDHDDPQHANAVIEKIKQCHVGVVTLYGGSVSQQTVQQFIAQPAIDGVLVGSASLDPDEFTQLISQIA